MKVTPVGGAIAEYRGQRFSIVFSKDDWVALGVEDGADIPDGFASGQYPNGFGYVQKWIKVPRSVLDGIVVRRVRGKVKGQWLTLQQQLPDGRISAEFIGSPSTARELGLEGDQYMGWSGFFDPDDFDSIEVEETRRA